MATTKNYTPVSHFFVEYSALTDVTPSTAAPSTEVTSIQPTTSSPFGPVSISQYCTTSVVQTSSTTPVKVFAICDGQILIQPCVNDVSNKVNLVLKPTANYAPFKIKYFVYRGVNKADLISTDSKVVKWDTSVSGQPELLHIIYNSKSSEENIPGENVGYKESTDATFLATSIDSCFTSTSGYQLPVCSAGDHIGYFSTSIGLDVVLDDGVYTLDKTTEPFAFDLSYARVLNHYLDTSKVAAKISGITDANLEAYTARYREYVHQFMDAAAFWGSHADTSGGIIVGSAQINDASIIYSNVLQKYQTPNNVYIYLKTERGRSYNFADTAKKVYFEQTDTTSTPNYYLYQDTSGWPILIKQYTTSSIYMKVQYHITRYVYLMDRKIPVKIISPRCVFFSSDLPSLLVADSSSATNYGAFEYTFDDLVLDSDKTIASFIFIEAKVEQSESENYYDDLWMVNIPKNESLTTSTLTWNIIDKGIIKDLSPILHYGVEIQHKIIQEVSSNGVNRRLYQAVIKDNTRWRESQVFGNESKLNIGLTPPPKTTPSITSTNSYIENVYDRNLNYGVYKSTFTDNISYTTGITTVNVSSLSLINTEDFELNRSYFQLGITESQYDDIVKIIPNTADNVYFYLSEMSVEENCDFRRFLLGIRYEDAQNKLQIVYPTESVVRVYTLDGLYFFSADYAESYEYNKTFADSLACFRPQSTWTGEFGFDWIRIGDTELPGDEVSWNIDVNHADRMVVVDRIYYNNIGHSYSTTNVSSKLDANSGSTTFNFEIGEWLAFRNNYPSYPIKKYTAVSSKFLSVSLPPVNYSMYSASIISLYPSDVTNSGNVVFPGVTTDGTKKCYVEATLDLRLEVSSSATSFRVAYNSAYLAVTFSQTAGVTFTATAGNCKITGLSSGTNTLTVTVKSIQGAGVYQKIQVYAVEGGSEKLAGELWVMPNDKNHRKNMKVYLVGVKTQLGTSEDVNHGIDYESSSTQIKTLENTITKYFNQALIDITCITKSNNSENLEIDTTSEMGTFSYKECNQTFFNDDFLRTALNSYEYKDSNGNSQTTSFCLKLKTASDEPMHNKLYNVISNNNTSYSDGLVFFYVNEICLDFIEENSVFVPLFGVAFKGATLTKNANSVILFRGDSSIHSLIDSTSAHEGCHDLGLSHTFSNSADFTMQIFSTDNLMDYSSEYSATRNQVPIDQISTWRVQWNEIIKHYVIKESGF